MPTHASYPEVTDLFCGAGGSSQGAALAGGEIRLAMNHSKLAIDTHASNFPQAKHDCCDISAADPRRYPSTPILIASPECTNHTIAKGAKKYRYSEDLFGNALVDPVAERSRATMWDVVRFAEHHQYKIIIVENVVDAKDWLLFDEWKAALRKLGYELREVYLNSMFCLPTPQSRDRLYVVCWRKGQRPPDLDIRPKAPCMACGAVVEAVQRWRNPARAWGRYGARRQYVYTCPTCHAEVHPFYMPAYSAIDFSIPAPLIGERKRPLAEKTMARIKAGLAKFADSHVLLETAQSTGGGRAYPIAWSLPTQTTAQSLAMLQVPFRGIPSGKAILGPRVIVQRTHHTQRSVTDPLSTFATGNTHYLVAPFVETDRNGRGDPGVMSHGVHEPLSTVTATDPRHLVVPAAVLASYYGTQADAGVDEPLASVTGRDRHALVQIPFVAELHGGSDARASTDALGTVVAAGIRHGVVEMPFIAELKGTSAARSAAEALMTVTAGGGHHGLVEVPAPIIYGRYQGPYRNPFHTVADPPNTLPTDVMHHLLERRSQVDPAECGFRMLSPEEIQRGMAFDESYVVLGNKAERVMQLGNAVTPPAMQILVERCLKALYD
jgi:DNA (cytosine-5)-methyltransferase 1